MYGNIIGTKNCIYFSRSSKERISSQGFIEVGPSSTLLYHKLSFGWYTFHFDILTVYVNTLRPRQNERHFPDDTFKRIFLTGNVIISIKISLKFVPKGPINKIPALVQIMAWRRPGDKPLSEPTMVRLMTHICVTRLQWVM